jgi:hypothetical protein
LERISLFERKQHGTTLVPFFFCVVFAPVFRPAALIESDQENGSPIGEPFLFARQQIAAGQEKIMPA